MTYDFDKVIDRTGSLDVKNEVLRNEWKKDDLIPLWVADMDFETPPFVVEALKKRMEHPIFGYTIEPPTYWPTIRKWVGDHHGWDVKEEWMTYIPGIVKGIGMVINVFLEKDEKVIIQPPVYHPFRLVPEGNKRQVVYNPLIRREDGGYEMDFENLEKVADEKCKLLILSNPHNPAGILWKRETLEKLAHICKEKGILVISDEIHCDMALWGKKHIPFASVSEEAASNSITFMAPSKTFNIAGIVSSWTVVPDDAIREKFFGWLHASEFNAAPLFSPIATMAAFEQGEEWRQQMLRYIEGNITFLEDYCKKFIPEIKPLRPEASFLVWLDCRRLGLNHEDLQSLFVDKAHLALNDGEMFGKEGAGFMRLNVAEPRSILKKALEQLQTAVQEIRK